MEGDVPTSGSQGKPPIVVSESAVEMLEGGDAPVLIPSLVRGTIPMETLVAFVGGVGGSLHAAFPTIIQVYFIYVFLFVFPFAFNHCHGRVFVDSGAEGIFDKGFTACP